MIMIIVISQFKLLQRAES